MDFVCRYPPGYPNSETREASAGAEVSKPLIYLESDGGRCRSRTYDPLIKSQLLYQLS